MKIFYDLNLSIKHGEIFIVKYGYANIFYLILEIIKTERI